MAKIKTFPHYYVDYRDDSATEVLITEELPLHRPIFFSLAAKGEIGKPYWGDYTYLKEVLGEETFDMYSKFYKHDKIFIKNALQYQKVFIVRVADAAAASASAVLECRVTTGVDVTQYEKDEFGGRVLDGNGDPVPLLEEDEITIVTEPGIEIVWVLRQLTVDEESNALAPTVVDSTTTYPIVVINGTSPGSLFNNYGVKFWFDWADIDDTLVENIEALVFNFAAIGQPYGVDTPQPIRDMYDNTYVDFTFKPDSIDPTVDRRVYLEDILQNDYKGSIPYDFYIYSDYIKTIGDIIAGLESAIDDFDGKDGWMANPLTGIDTAGHYYDHVVVKTDGVTGATFMDEDIIQYMSGGSDGATDETTYDSLVNTWLAGSQFPDIKDHARYPITHLYDSGYTLDTKKTMIDFLGIRDDVKVIMSTQDVNNGANTKAEDQSAGSSLRTQILLHPGSTVYGTQAFRGTIHQQCGYIPATGLDANYNKIVPLTLDNLIKKCKYQGAIYFKGKPKGRPASEVTCLERINWFPNSDDHKQQSWDTGLNYVQYFDMTGYHYADVRSVYPLDTSLISDDIVTDILVYLNHIARINWSIFVGRDENPNTLFGEIEDTISKDIYNKFRQYAKCEVSAYQTDVDKALGYKSTIEIRYKGSNSQRVWGVLVPVQRDDE